MRLRCACVVIILAIAAAWALPARAFFGTFPVSDDVWDVKQGGAITGSSDILAGSSAWNMIGACEGSVEPYSGSALFADNASSGSWHWIRHSTPTDVHIISFNVFASNDGPGAYARSFDYIRLSYIPTGGTQWVTYYEAPIAVPYLYEEEFGQLLFSHTLDHAITGHQFQAEFRQHTDVEYAKGPRVLELDGFVTAPEPGSVLCICTAVISFAGFVTRGRRSSR